MKRSFSAPLKTVFLISVFITNGMPQAVEESKSLFDFESIVQLEQVQANGVDMTHVTGEQGGSILLVSKTGVDWPGVTLKPKSGAWDGTGFQHLSMDVTNVGKHDFEIGLRIDNPGGNGHWNSTTVMTHLSPGQSSHIQGLMVGAPWRFDKPLRLEGMHRAPGQQSIDPSNIVQVIIFLRMPTKTHKIRIDNVQFETPLTLMKVADFLPFIDEYGQFIHDDWPGKTHSQEDLDRVREEEKRELAQHLAPSSFNQYGGWDDGPHHGPARFFRTHKDDQGRWWLVDPEGAQFWSHGIDSVSVKFGSTPIQHREAYFRNLPTSNSPFLHDSSWGMGFYHDKVPYKSFNFYAANMSRKWGDDWFDAFAQHAHKRLRSWGMNTLACWSDPRVNQLRMTPYTAFFRCTNCPVLEGSEKKWTQFVDVFDDKFLNSIHQGLKSCEYAIGDSWCIGFFVDNELHWGDPKSLAIWTLKSPADQAAKKEFVSDLKSKYKSIEALNRTWKTGHADWDSLIQSTEPPDLQLASEDLLKFTRKFTDKYFRTIDEVLEQKAPNQMYLGCRFFWANDTAVRVACKYCDVISYNRYAYTADSLRLPPGEDRPVLIGEFHFGALDRGLFHPTRVPTGNQEDRARAYRLFVKTALSNPLIVGTHWFQYTSEPTTGRGDGENYQVGFVDICDTPYAETVNAARTMGATMYDARSKTLSDHPEE